MPPAQLDPPTIDSDTPSAYLNPDGVARSKVVVEVSQQQAEYGYKHTVIQLTTAAGPDWAAALEIVMAPDIGQATFDDLPAGVTYWVRGMTASIYAGTDSAWTDDSVTGTTAGDTTAPAQVTGAVAYNGILAIGASWTASAATDLSHYEAQIDDNSGFTTPETFKTKSTLITFTPLTAGTYYVRVRAVDLSGNAGTYSATVNAVARLTDYVTSPAAKVTIDAAGITIVDGALFIQDAYGTSVLGASGFSGSWQQFISTGFYNGDYFYGSTVDIPVTEVSGGDSLADYAASITDDLPYWVVAASDALMYINTAAAGFANTSALAIASSGAAQTSRWYQDIPWSRLAMDTLQLQFKMQAYTVYNGTTTVNIYTSDRDINHGLLGSRTLKETFTYDPLTLDDNNQVTGVAATDLFTTVDPHGLVAGDSIVFTATTNGTGVSTATRYYIIASGLTANDFRVSTTLGGGTINFTTNLTAPSRYVKYNGTVAVQTHTAGLGDAGSQNDTAFIRVEYEVVQAQSGQTIYFGRSQIQDSIYAELVSSSEVDATDLFASSAQVNDLLILDSIDTSDAVLQGGGTSFPGSPTTGDRFYRTDYRMWFFYDGTRWLSDQLFLANSGTFAASGTYATSISATQTSVNRISFPHSLGTDIWIEDFTVVALISSGGSALSASHKWVGSLMKVDASNAGTSMGTCSIDSGTSSPTWHNRKADIDALLGTTATYSHVRLDWTKTGTPGALNITAPFAITYRIVAT
jgi:hypothetical protein